MLKKNKIFITSGGTGGHIMPARCLALELVEQNFEVFFFGDSKYRSYIKENDKFISKIIISSKLEKSMFKLFFAAVKIALGLLQSLYFFLKIRPKYVVAFGGYSTFPILLAALIFKTKIIIHEQNSHLGKVNRIFAKYAYKIATSFAKTSGIAKGLDKKVVFVGNPIRKEIIELNKNPYIPFDFEPKREIKIRPDNKMGYDVVLASDFYQEKVASKPYLFNILIIGGSGGAKIFSEILPKAFFNLGESLKEKIAITQQCRKELTQSTFEQYRSFNITITIDSFFEDMPRLIQEAHLIIGRSGSSSIFEFCAARKPMILIPFALAADNHQEKNARYLEEHGAAIVITEKEFTINRINNLIKNIIINRSELQKMAENAGNLAVIGATKNLAKLVNE
jgi:UDP-N-acetylglucosamine--N-acetylmuramyl-(pentapeptide) pyrophosphoryl-undecaprenol N-acetylglucosamine transferase